MLLFLSAAEFRYDVTASQTSRNCIQTTRSENLPSSLMVEGTEAARCENLPSSMSMEESEVPCSLTPQTTRCKSLPCSMSMEESEFPSSLTSQTTRSQNNQSTCFPALQHLRKRKATEAVCLSAKSQLEELVGERLSESVLDDTSHSGQQLVQPRVPVGEQTSDSVLHNTSYIDHLIVPSSCESPDSSRLCDEVYFPALCFKDHIKNKGILIYIEG